MKPTLALCSLALLGACGGASRGASTTSHPRLPAALTNLESTAEHAYGRALAKDQLVLARDIQRIGADWSELRPEVAGVGGTPNLLDELDAAVSALAATAANGNDAGRTARAANRISGALADVYALFEIDGLASGAPDSFVAGPAPARPMAPGVMQLDYLGRELALDGRAADFMHAQSDLGRLESAWADLRPEVPVASATSFDAAMKSAHDAVASGDGARVSKGADDVALGVEGLERLID